MKPLIAFSRGVDALNAAASSAGGKSTVAHALELSTGGPITILVAEDDA